jgi:hypothetical protein
MQMLQLKSGALGVALEEDMEEALLFSDESRAGRRPIRLKGRKIRNKIYVFSR